MREGVRRERVSKRGSKQGRERRKNGVRKEERMKGRREDDNTGYRKSFKGERCPDCCQWTICPHERGPCTWSFLMEINP